MPQAERKRCPSHANKGVSVRILLYMVVTRTQIGNNWSLKVSQLVQTAACKRKCFQRSKLHEIPAMLGLVRVEDGRNSLNQIFIDHELPTCAVG